MSCLLTVILILLLQCAVYSDFNNQPRIIAHEGQLVFQSAHDKNITTRLGGSSRFMVNDVNILESLQNVVEISSPTKSNGLYPSNAHCTWKITSKSDFQIKFQHFSLQNVSDTTGRCLDYVAVAYHHNRIGEHCGSMASFVIIVDKYHSDASADITLHTDESVESTGFTLTATNRPYCNRTFNDTSGVIKVVLNANKDCRFHIDMPDSYTVNIIIPHFFLSEFNCSTNYEYIRIYDSNTNRQIYERCTENYEWKQIFTSTNRVRLDFKAMKQERTNIFFYGSQKPSPAGCGGNFTTHLGFLASPNYAEHGHASVCRWNLEITAPNRFEISFKDFNMGSVCRSDYFDIIEISANGKEKVARHYCENDMPQNYYSE